MPLYEEKLISPLALRFTQQRIRTSFRDGHLVESTIKEIKAAPGVGDYDIILKAPFPAIEIIRYSPDGRHAGGEDHWFTFDNRRLYCLQRMAAKYWPKRVGCIVEVLYADSSATSIRKKLDSMTGGVSVTIGHAFAVGNELQEWAWRQAVQKRAPPGAFALQAEDAVRVDAMKTSVGDLTDAPAAPSAFERLMAAEFEAQSRDTPECKRVVLEEAPTQDIPECKTTVPEEAQSHDVPECETVVSEEPSELQGPVISKVELPWASDNSLTDLIGQLLRSKTETLPIPEHGSDDSRSTNLSERTESTGSDMSESAMLSPSGSVSARESGDEEDKGNKAHAEEGKVHEEEEVKFVSASDKDDEGDKGTVQQDCLPSASQLENSNKKEIHELPKPPKKEGKKTRTSKSTQQAQFEATWAAQAAQAQMAQYQMAQWQMAQWQSAQMAHWQQASYASQAAQLRAAAVAARWEI